MAAKTPDELRAQAAKMLEEADKLEAKLYGKIGKFVQDFLKAATPETTLADLKEDIEKLK